MVDAIAEMLVEVEAQAGRRQLWRTMRMVQETQKALAMDLDPEYAKHFEIPEWPIIKQVG
jgi:hypothetical protein